MIDQIELPYLENSATLFSCIADHNWSMFLDSGYPSDNAGRYDILVTEPIATVVTDADTTTVSTQTSTKRYKNSPPFDILRNTINVYAPQKKALNKDSQPFQSGALGYFSYDLVRTIEEIPTIAVDAEELPQMAVGIYTWAIIVDHQQKKTYLTGEIVKKNSHWNKEKLIRIFSNPIKAKPTTNQQTFSVNSEIKSNLSYNEYREAFKQIKHYILNGDCYQINLTQRFSATASGNPWDAYQPLRKLNPAPFSAYLNTPFGQILSSSPERFLKVEQQTIETKPIKGTRPRAHHPVEDQQQKENLRSSAKDRAENIMIVDLLRNDIGRVCKTGSVTVPSLFGIESYATVHHLVSTIKGTLTDTKDSIDLLQACFPGGSITGAPKIRAMEIIETLEPQRRGIYCGSIGYIDFNGNMDTNIAIRTLIYNQNTIRYWVGGGIVYDSKLEEEYQETFDKGKALFQLLHNFRYPR